MDLYLITGYHLKILCSKNWGRP